VSRRPSWDRQQVLSRSSTRNVTARGRTGGPAPCPRAGRRGWSRSCWADLAARDFPAGALLGGLASAAARCRRFRVGPLSESSSASTSAGRCLGRVGVPIEGMICLYADHHPGDVSGDRQLVTRERLRANVTTGESGEAGTRGRPPAPGPGPLRALLTQDAGLVLGHERQGRGLRVIRGRDFHATGRACRSLTAGRLDQGRAKAFPDARSCGHQHEVPIVVMCRAIGRAACSRPSGRPAESPRGRRRPRSPVPFV